MVDSISNENIGFGVRGIGSDNTPGCFICGGEQGLYSNIAAFVESKADGEKVVRMFEYGARLDFRSREPDWIQVKIGACKKHTINLERLEYFCSDGYINPARVASAINLQKKYTAGKKVVAKRNGRVDVVSKLLQEDLKNWAVGSGQIKGDRSYPISILRTEGGYTRQLVFDDRELICSVTEEKDTLAVNLNLAKKMPVGPWDSSLVKETFLALKGREVVIPEEMTLPKIVSYTIKPEKSSTGDGFEVKIIFTFLQNEKRQYDVITNIISAILNTGLETRGCCHFFTDDVYINFPKREAADAAVAGLLKICGQV